MSESTLPRRYNYQYRTWLFAGRWSHSYELVGRWGGIHLLLSDLGEDHHRYSDERYSAGLEVHYRQPPIYMADDPPSHNECFLIHAPCWHDGTSLYARKAFVPLFDGKDHLSMFRRLASDADRRFEEFAALYRAHPEDCGQ